MYCDNGLQQSSLWAANTCIPPFLNTYPILLHTSKPFPVSFPLSGCPSPLHHLANSFNIHDKRQLHYEPFPSLAPTSHRKQSGAPHSAPLTPCLDLTITLHGHCYLPYYMRTSQCVFFTGIPPTASTWQVLNKFLKKRWGRQGGRKERR